MSTAPWRPLLALLLLAALLRDGEAAVTVVPMRRGPPSAPQQEALIRLAQELALRCPSGRLQPFAQLRPLLARAHEDPLAPPNGPSQDLQTEFLRTEDWRGTAARLLQHAEDLEQTPVALLTNAALRRRLREAHLFAARALLSAGDEQGARRVLRMSAVRLRDLPSADSATWGPALQVADHHARQQLPAPVHSLLLQGPPGLALHVDEQPVGALPQAAVAVAEGRHGVVLVAPDGTRTSWVVEVPAAAAPAQLRLHADARLREQVCVMEGVAGLCAAAPSDATPPSGWESLAWAVNSDLLVVSADPRYYRAWLLQRGRLAAQALEVPAGRAAALITRTLCAPSPTAAPPPARERRPDALGRPPRWPALLLMGLGAAALVSAVPLFALHGRCVAEDCARAYNFNWLAGTLVGAGGAAALGGGLWSTLVRR